MIKIAICDDEVDICQELDAYIINHTQKLLIDNEVSVYYSADGLLDSINRGASYDLIFLDIEMEGLSGIEFGKFVREQLKDDETRIVFISWHRDYAMKLFNIRAYNFLIKPLENNLNKIHEILEKINQEITKSTKYFSYQIKRKHFSVNSDDIMYFVSDNRHVTIYMKNSEARFYEKLDCIEERLDSKRFVRSSKSVLVNMDYVQCYETYKFTMKNGDELEISRAYKDGVHDIYLRRWMI